MPGRPTAMQIFRGLLRGPLTTRADGKWAGRTVLNSGSATVTVSTTLVNSDSIILYGLQRSTATGSGVVLVVRSINPGVAFVFGTAAGETVAADTTIMWLLFQTQ